MTGKREKEKFGIYWLNYPGPGVCLPIGFVKSVLD